MIDGSEKRNRQLPLNFKIPLLVQSVVTTLLKNLELRFSFIGLTETWLRDSPHHTDISGYIFVHNLREDMTGGSVCLYLVDNFDFNVDLT